VCVLLLGMYVVLRQGSWTCLGPHGEGDGDIGCVGTYTACLQERMDGEEVPNLVCQGHFWSLGRKGCLDFKGATSCIRPSLDKVAWLLVRGGLGDVGQTPASFLSLQSLSQVTL